MSSKYLRHGHAPGDLREAFVNWVYDNNAELEIRGKKRTAEWLFGQLWNCKDILPGSECSMLDLTHGSTYAQAVQKLKADLTSEQSPPVATGSK